MSYFTESYYLQSKIAQLNNLKIAGPNDAWTEASLKAALLENGMTPREHYLQYGRAEGLNPNPYFNEAEYLAAKAKQLNSIKYDGRTDWTADQVAQGIEANGMIPVEHYERYGAFERDATDRFINPSNAFDANAYWSAKLLLLQQTDPSMTLEKILAGFQDSELSPVSHYMAYGAGEANAADFPLVQAVSVGQRVPNDPVREDLGQCVPGNYGSNTPQPTNTGRQVASPADVGGLADDNISPPVVSPSYNLPVPGDAHYVRLPSNVTWMPSGDYDYIPPSTSGTGKVSDNWVIVDKDTGAGIIVAPNGEIKGQVQYPEGLNTNTDTLPPIDPDMLPDNIRPNDTLDNNFIDTTPPPYVPPAPPVYITVAQSANTTDVDVTGNLAAGQSATVTLGANKTVTATENGTGSADLSANSAILSTQGVTGAGELVFTVTSNFDNPGIVILGNTTARNRIDIAGKINGFVGGAGDDIISIASGTVSDVSGGAGNDTINIAAGATIGNSIHGNAGNDTYNIAAGATIGIGGLRDTAGNDTYNLSTGTHGYTIVDTVGNNSINFTEGTVNLTLETDTDFTGTINGSTDVDTLTITSGATVNGSIQLGAGNDTISLSGTHSFSVVDTVGTNSISFIGLTTLTLEADTDFTGNISGSAGIDTVTIQAGATVTGDINLDYGNDTITIVSGATVTGTIYGGAGADTINLPAFNSLTLGYGVGDSGTYSSPDSGQTIGTSAFDVIEGVGGSTRFYVANASFSTSPSSSSSLPSGPNSTVVCLVHGTQSGSTFTAGSGNDALVLFDPDGGGSSGHIGIVLIGVGDAAALTVDTSATFSVTTAFT